MSSQQATFILALVALALSFRIPEWLALAAGFGPEHALLIIWWAAQSPWIGIPLALLYGLAGFLVLAAACAAVLEIGKALLAGMKAATLFIMNTTARLVRALVRLVIKVLLGPFRPVASTGRKQGDQEPAAPSGSDPLSSAMHTLGLPDGFTRAEFETRYRTLMKGVHPDVAGPNALARQLNDARDLIRKARGWR